VGFDVVIGNPPYILVQSFGDQNIFEYYKTNYQTATYKIDTYALFYEEGIKLLSLTGLLGYITPNTFLKNKHSKELRTILLSCSINEIINFYIQVFEDASVDTLILLLSKCEANSNHEFLFCLYRNSVSNLSNTDKIKHKQIEFKKGNYELELDVDSNERDLLSKIEFNTKPLSEFGRSYFGIQTFDRKQFVSKTKNNDDYYPVIDGGNINRFTYKPFVEFVHFKKESIKSGGDLEVYKKYRIVVRQIGKYPEGTIIEPYLMTLNTIYNFFLYKDDIDFLRFILSLLNSKLFQFYWTKKFYDNKATFPKIKKEPLESLPIKEASQAEIIRFSILVENVMKYKQESLDTTLIESDIDQLVYQLYGLTEVEIGIVEGK
jgi:adenine-specific DNA-methyltransferase